MAKTKKQKMNLVKLSYFLNGCLLITVVLLVFAVYKARDANTITQKIERPKIDVNLGAMRYAFSDDKAIKRTDASIKELQNFLEAEAEKNILLGCSSNIYHVARYNQEETQILLNFGCENMNAHMYAVKDEHGWRLLSPTNQFDDLGTPTCDHVNQNDISPEIAPVCMNGWGESNDQHEYIDRQTV